MMSHHLTIHEQPNYLHFLVTGQNTSQNVKAYLEEIAAICKARQCSVVLIEENLEGPGLSLGEMFHLASAAPEVFGHLRKIAYVDINPIHSQPDLKFVETVAANRHGGVRMFKTVAEAREWIEGEVGHR
jgi:hypothetical protein